MVDPPPASEQSHVASSAVTDEQSISEREQQMLTRALQYVREERLLPPPEDATELLAGIAAWIARHWSEDPEKPDEPKTARPCSNCGGRNWEVGSVVSVDGDPRWPTLDGGPPGSFPYFQLGCHDCGHTIFVNALLVFEPQAPKKQ